MHGDACCTCARLARADAHQPRRCCPGPVCVIRFYHIKAVLGARMLHQATGRQPRPCGPVTATILLLGTSQEGADMHTWEAHGLLQQSVCSLCAAVNSTAALLGPGEPLLLCCTTSGAVRTPLPSFSTNMEGVRWRLRLLAVSCCCVIAHMVHILCSTAPT
jgi:hypothetical protein